MMPQTALKTGVRAEWSRLACESHSPGTFCSVQEGSARFFCKMTHNYFAFDAFFDSNGFKTTRMECFFCTNEYIMIKAIYIQCTVLPPVQTWLQNAKE